MNKTNMPMKFPSRKCESKTPHKAIALLSDRMAYTHVFGPVKAKL